MYAFHVQNSASAESDLIKLRIAILEAASVAKEGHVPSALSILNIIYCIFLEDLKDFDLEPRDFSFILSKGHASLGLYAVLAEAKFFSDDWIHEFGEFNSNFGGHPDRNKVNGVLASTGSLGHGLPIGVGMSLAHKARGTKEAVIVLIGDGELNEGSNWESLLIAHHHALSNLIIIIDQNQSSDRAIRMENLSEKFNAFGMQTFEIDGHDHKQIISTVFSKESKTPKVVIANTTKGYGVQEMENNPAWHHASPTAEQFLAFVNELQK